MDLSLPVQAFFRADEVPSSDAPLDAFAQDAIVKDEGHTHAGHPAIAGWWRATKAKYQHSSKPLKVAKRDGTTEVRARVTGQFPGGQADLTFTFLLAGEKIAVLEIAP